MATEWKREYECVCRDGSSEFYVDETDAIAFAEQEACERVEVIVRYLDDRNVIWTRGYEVDADGYAIA